MSLINNLKQFYGDLKLQSKFTIVLVLAITVPILMIGVFFYGRLYEMVVSYTIRQEQDASAETAPVIEAMVQEVLDAYDTLTALPFCSRLFGALSEESPTELLSSDDALAFCRQAEELIDGELITGIQIYLTLPDDSQNFFDDYSSTVFAPLLNAKGTYWYGIFQGSNASELYCPSFYLGSQEQKRLGDLAYIGKTYYQYQSQSFACYIAVYYSSDPLREILVGNLTLDGSVSYIMNERDALVASSNESLSGIYWLDYTTIEESFMSSNNFIERTILDATVYVGFYNISQPGWFMVTVLPSAPLIEQSNMLMIQYAAMYIVFIVLALILSSILTHSVTGRISSVISQMRLVRQGLPAPMENPSYHDEVGDLIDTYNYMTRKIDTLIEEQGKAAEELRISEFNSLQAQINPHFLYNTMDMINWLAQQGRTDEVSDAIQNLSRFYRLTLSRKSTISTIAQEEEHITIYVRLQNMRFHNGITFIPDIPDELQEYPIPKLTLQPVIENAILHGILESENKTGTIVLTGWREDGAIILLISDDGVGMTGEQLANILSGAGNSSSGGANIAIYNTHRRLQILYGLEYGLSYSSKPGQGTEVQIRIPAQKEYQSPYVHTGEHTQILPATPLVSISDAGRMDSSDVNRDSDSDMPSGFEPDAGLVSDFDTNRVSCPDTERSFSFDTECSFSFDTERSFSFDTERSFSFDTERSFSSDMERSFSSDPGRVSCSDMESSFDSDADPGSGFGLNSGSSSDIAPDSDSDMKRIFAAGADPASGIGAGSPFTADVRSASAAVGTNRFSAADRSPSAAAGVNRSAAADRSPSAASGANRSAVTDRSPSAASGANRPAAADRSPSAATGVNRPAAADRSPSTATGANRSAVSPETLLEYSQKLTHNLYRIEDLHRISEQFSPADNLYILTHEVTSDFPAHTHSYFEFNYVCSGSLINVVDGNELYMEPGDLVFLNTSAIHSLTYRKKNTLLINFCLKPELFERTLKSFYEDQNAISDFLHGTHSDGSNYIFFSLGHSLRAQSILASIIREYAANDFHQSFALESWFLLLFSYLVNADEFSYYGVDSLTHQILRYLQEHGASESAETAAAQFSLTAEQLDGRLKKHTGRSLDSFLHEARLDKAPGLLADPALNIYQIAESCGYADADEFFERFRRKYGVSPTEYRRQFL